MTRYTQILIPTDQSDRTKQALRWGMLVAQAHQAWAVGLHVRPDPTTALPLVGEGMSGAMVEDMLAVANKQAQDRAGKAQALFHEIAQSMGCDRVQWRDLTGREEELVARQGRLSDLLVMSMPQSTMDIAAMLTLNAALMESGKPILLCPAMAEPVLPQRVAIAWNGSLEASRTVSAALPILTQAEQVLILSAPDMAPQMPSAAELAGFLTHHGIDSRQVAMKSSHHAGQHILDVCQGEGVQMLVMGAYTHSRLRQLIMGGVTRHMLDHSPIACLMGH